MTTLSQYKEGDFLFRQGDASEPHFAPIRLTCRSCRSASVLRVKSGEIEILREVGATSVLLGHVRDAEWLGEMGVIEGRSRNATARAVTDGEVEVLTARQFLERVSSDPALAHDLILRLSVRLRRIEDKIAEDLLPFAHDRSSDRAGEPASDAVIADDAAIWLAAQSDALRARIGAAPIHVAKPVPWALERLREHHHICNQVVVNNLSFTGQFCRPFVHGHVTH
jgi:CRP/FNR family transcriptional regulator, cyclic AMP receptor protein